MDASDVDPIVSSSLSRRAALRGAGAGGVAALLLTAGLERSAAAQTATPGAATTYAPSVYAEIIGHKVTLAASDYNLQLVRITFDPGSSVAPHTHPGDTVTYQFYGSHVYTLLAGSALIVRAGADPAGEALTINAPTTVMPGDVLLFDAHTAHTAHNPGKLPAVLLESQMRKVGEPLTMPIGTPTT